MGVKREGTGLMGWCLPFAEDHDKCRVAYTDWNGKERRCTCPCHEPKKARRKTTVTSTP